MTPESIAILERRQADLRSQFASIGEMRSGSLTERFRRCGRPWCHCAKPDAVGHGPVLSLTRKRAGKTVTRVIPAQAAAQTRAQVAEYQRFRQLSKAFVDVSDALSEARLTPQRGETAEAAKKGASRQVSRPRSRPKSKHS